MRRVAILFCDLVSLAVAAVLALLLRDNLEIYPGKLPGLAPYVLACVAFACPINLILGLDRRVSRFSDQSDYIRIVIGVACSILGATLVMFTINRMDNIARSIPILHSLVAVCLSISWRMALQRLERHPTDQRPDSWDPANANGSVLIVGLSSLTVLYLKAIGEFAGERLRIGGIVAHDQRHVGQVVLQHKIFDPAQALPKVIRDLSVHGVFIDRIVVATGLDQLPQRLRDEVKSIAETTAIRVEYLVDQLGLAPASLAAKANPYACLPMGQTFSFSSERLKLIQQRYFWLAKRGFDIVVSAVALLILAPLLAVFAGLVKFTIGSPTVFWQERPGYGGKPFRLYKFRTMAAAHDDAGRRISEEGRLNHVGRFLRRTRLDELPQLYNILCGDMSFVGPRPLLPVDQPDDYSARLLVRPGLTGWAQVMAGREISAADKSALDVWYVQNASLKLDLEVIARTVPMILFGERVSSKAINRAWEDLRLTGVCAAIGDKGAVSAQERPPVANVLGGRAA